MVTPEVKEFFSTNKVLLGSSSKWRRKVMEQQGMPIFGGMSPDIDEDAIRDPDPSKLCGMIARGKRDELVKRLGEKKGPEGFDCGFVICSDQVAFCNGEIREKPKNREEHLRWLSDYGDKGHPVTTFTAVTVFHWPSGVTASGIDRASVHFKSIPDDAKQKLADTEMLYTCSGGFAIDIPEMSSFIERIDGDEDSVMGLPVRLLGKLLLQCEKEQKKDEGGT
mmetsp:Transcript_34024/g.67359  ORF Transcript_34024/g.67359 Transcript_34024/m.67359 type:complete len:222 (-) Transcript_34024:120-785(-)